MKSVIEVLGDPAHVLNQIQQIVDAYDRLTARFPFGKMLEDAERVAGSIDVPPFVDNRLIAAIAEIKILIDQTLGAAPGEPSN